MVQDVFEVSKAASGQLPVHLERLDFAKLLRQTLADLEGPISQSGLTFRMELPEIPVMITADGRRLYRVFQNLIDNALKYALAGSRVYLSLKTEAGRAEASLRNTSREELPTGVDLTARFVRGDASRTDGGSGLGLSIASSFTEACGGDFHVETLADLFTAVVSFPWRRSPEPSKQKPRPFGRGFAVGPGPDGLLSAGPPLSLAQINEIVRHLLGEQAARQGGLLRRVAGGPYLYQQGAGGGVLVIAGIPQQDRPHQGGIALQDIVLKGHRQFQILHPVLMSQAAAVAAHHQSHLGGGAHPVDLRDHLVLIALPRRRWRPGGHPG